jgi:molybdopterin molybdotransferase
MDGYAMAGVAPEGACRVVREIPAGCSEPGAIRPGEAARIFTGAALPAGTACVARQEDCLVEGSLVRLRDGLDLQWNENIRRGGDVFRRGSVLIPPSKEITPGAVALLSSCGVDRVNAHARPAVAHISTGLELIDPGSPLNAGRIYDSNGPMMEALLSSRGLGVRRLRMLDSLDQLAGAAEAFDGDLLLISGGSGPGDHDHTRAALELAGFTIRASRINSRPGKPLIFATRSGQVAFGLPGNPLSHWVCFQAFVARALSLLEGKSSPELIGARCVTPPGAGGDGRRTWTPARRRFRDGHLFVEPLEWKHSGDLSPLVAADAVLLDGPDPETQLIKTLLL